VGRTVAALLLLTVGAAAARQVGAAWQEAPEFRRLFAPAAQRADAYRTYVSPMSIDAVLTELGGDPSLLRPPGAWEPRATLPLDAFGQDGVYNRWDVLRLYGAQRAMVARGPRAQNGRVVESWTLISPHPDATLQRLERGTLLIVLKLP
jgi:hypothetical protein